MASKHGDMGKLVSLQAARQASQSLLKLEQRTCGLTRQEAAYRPGPR